MQQQMPPCDTLKLGHAISGCNDGATLKLRNIFGIDFLELADAP